MYPSPLGLNSPISQVDKTGTMKCRGMSNAAKYLGGIFVNYTAVYVENVLKPALKKALAKQSVYQDIDNSRHHET